ncbi:MAG: nuclear transport factor 2 family protein [Thermomicrobiales bacterium]
MTMSNARKLVDRYFTALKQKDFAAMRPLLHDDVSFKGALGTTEGAEDYISGLQHMMATMTGMERRVIFAEGEEVCQVYDLTLATPPVTLPISQWLTVRDGRIAALRVYFDPRPLFETSA